MQETEPKAGTTMGDEGCDEAARQDSPSRAQTSSTSDTGGILDIEMKANDLFNYLDRLNSIADRASKNTLTQKEPRLDDSDLRNPLDQSRPELEQKNIAYANLEKISMEQFVKMENRFSELQTQLGQREQELKTLTAEISSFIRLQRNPDRSNQADEVLYPPDVEPLTQEIAVLKAELARRDDTIRAKNNAFRKMETEYRAKMQEFENRMRENAVLLEQQEAVINHKEALIQATAMKEVEIGKLIKHLSAECDKLNGELQEKNRRLSQLENDKIQPTSEAKVWRPVVGRMQQEPT